jgi:hypothetical protein
MLGQILTGRVIFRPRATGTAWEVEYAADCSLGKLVSGLLVPDPMVAPTGGAAVGANVRRRLHLATSRWARA